MKHLLKVNEFKQLICHPLYLFVILLSIPHIQIKASDLGNKSFTSLIENTEKEEQQLTNTPPRSISAHFNIDESGKHIFSAADFYFEDDDEGDFLQKIKIYQPNVGYLEINGNYVYGEIEIGIADIGQLIYYSGTPYVSYNHDLIFFQVSDGLDYSVYNHFSINVLTGIYPVMVGYMPNQNFRNNTKFTFDIPYDLFMSTSPGELIITASEPNSYGILPQWLWFDGHTFHGSPTETGTFIFEISAYDGYSTVSTSFRLIIHDENAPEICKAEFYDSGLNFGFQMVGTTSYRKYISFKVSDETLCNQFIISSIQIDNDNFKLISTTKNTFSPGESYSFDVVHAPKIGGEHTGVLSIYHNGAESPFNVPLKGYGVAINENFCDPISILPCNEMRVSLPYELEFTGNEGGIANTGFTMADAYSGTVSNNDPLPVTSVRGLDVTRLFIENDKLNLRTNKGISLSTSNNQKNSLGVQFDARKKIIIQTRVERRPSSNSEEGGIWFGINDKNLVKLVLIGSNGIELRKEHNDISSMMEGIENPDQRIKSVSNVIHVYLKMEVDPYSNTIEGYYSLDGENYLNVGERYPISGLDISGMGLTVDGAFAGIQGSHHKDYYWAEFSFHNFSIKLKEDEQNIYNLSINKNGSGTVTPESGSYVSGSTVIVTASPDLHNSFTGWTGDASGNENPLTIVMDANKEVIANFEPIKYYVNVSASNGGSVILDPQKEFYFYDEVVLVTATPDAGYFFEGWTGSESTENSLRLTINDDLNLTANFSPIVEYNSTRINSGGKAINVDGTLWSGCFKEVNCDGYVTGGSSFTHKRLSNIVGVESTMNQYIFQTEWMGRTGKGAVAPGAVAFLYNIPVANGQYLIRLHFAEVTKSGQGQRAFDVNIEGGTKELINFDIFKEAGGKFKAIVKEFQTTVSDGDVTIEFIRQIDNAKINAIEIVPITSGSKILSASEAFKNISEESFAIHGKNISMEIYPNPAQKGYVTIEFSNDESEEMDLLVYDNIGIQVLARKISGDVIKAGKVEIELNEKYKRGVYLIMLKTPTSKIFKKLIID